jgi:predicted SPOUT superfamily RNA methylase MTH1
MPNRASRVISNVNSLKSLYTSRTPPAAQRAHNNPHENILHEYRHGIGTRHAAEKASLKSASTFHTLPAVKKGRTTTVEGVTLTIRP